MIKYLDLKRINQRHATEIQAVLHQVLESGWYLHGKQVNNFENAYAQYIGNTHCITCGNGLDALSLIFRAYIELGKLSPGQEVIVPANTFIATILSITENGLIPVLVEPSKESLQIDEQCLQKAITPQTAAIVLVHLYGRCAYTELIGNLCKKHGLLLIEDNAQAHGCNYQGQRTGSLGHAAAHSFYPAKNLGAMGDAGAVTTNDNLLAETVRALENYGCTTKYHCNIKGRNSRMDELQAAVLSIKLKYLDIDNERRKAIARTYQQHINHPLLYLPNTEADCVYHIFPIFSPQRDALQAHLSQCNIETMIHYPIPPHKQKCYKEWNQLSLPITEKLHREELSLPLHPALSQNEIEQIIDAVNIFPK